MDYIVTGLLCLTLLGLVLFVLSLEASIGNLKSYMLEAIMPLAFLWFAIVARIDDQRSEYKKELKTIMGARKPFWYIPVGCLTLPVFCFCLIIALVCLVIHPLWDLYDVMQGKKRSGTD